MINLTESNFLNESRKSELLLVEFRSELCAPCIRQDVVLEGLEKKITSNKIRFASVNIDDDPILESKFKIDATPTLILVGEGKIIGRNEGHLSESEIKTFIKQSIAEYRNRQD